MLRNQNNRLTLAVLLTLLLLPAASAAQTTTRAQRRQLTAELSRAAQELLAVIEKGEPAEFSKHVSRIGASFGVGTAALKPDAIEKQVASRTGIYCVLFDTACLMAEKEKKAALGAGPVSYRELLARAKSRRIEASVNEESGDLTGMVAVRFTGLPSDWRWSKEPLEFYFVRDRGAWMLSSVPFP